MVWNALDWQWIIGTGILGFLAGWFIRGLLIDRMLKKAKRHYCHMCQRQVAGSAAFWNIRGEQMYVCESCHPFYKARFDCESS